MFRRDYLLFAALAAVGACARSTAAAPAAPTLAQVKAWLQVLAQELPVFLDESETANLLKPAAVPLADAAVAKFQQTVTTLLGLPNTTDPASLLNDAVLVLTQILSLVPAAAPYIPLILTAQLVIAGFLASQPVTTPAGESVATPPPPAPAALQTVHAATRAAASK